MSTLDLLFLLLFITNVYKELKDEDTVVLAITHLIMQAAWLKIKIYIYTK